MGHGTAENPVPVSLETIMVEDENLLHEALCLGWKLGFYSFVSKWPPGSESSK